MLRTTAQPTLRQSTQAARPSLSSLLSASEDEFYGSLQRIWNNVVQLEDSGLIHDEHDKFVYAYRFAEEELHRAFSTKNGLTFPGHSH
jgi:hypothetical protein